ncbi:MAG: SAM-dependent methyltransferase [Clostridiales bacterium]|nr:SAM-dependent methyltransferase [Clostridiales bacterium]
MNETEKYIGEICALDVKKAVFSLAAKDSNYKKATVRKISENTYQIERFTEKQAFHENFPAEKLEEKVNSLFPKDFSQAEFFTDEYVYGAKFTKKGTLLHNRRKNDSPDGEISHNRVKKHIIDVENLPPVFGELGIMTGDGKIINSKYDKFKQICRFTELINDEVAKDPKETFNIIDFGCGKSYLSFVIYHYFSEILGKKVKITGLDLKKDVIDKCNTLAKKYGYDGMNFVCCDVNDYTAEEKPDMVIALHACDTATDIAIARAIDWGADFIFAAPCCQKEARKMIKPKNFGIITDYGIINERFCAMITDTLRAKLIEYSGYSCDITEFIDMEHSPKNLLIRAKKKPSADRYKKAKILSQIEGIKDEFGIDITLSKLLLNK